MPLSEPVPGLVIRYSYLWANEHERGQEEGVKDPPCAIILATTDEVGEKLVTVLPGDAYASIRSRARSRDSDGDKVPSRAR